MMNRKTVLIIPAYNEEAALGPLLDEVKAAVPDLDVVVINDGSTDSTSDVARSKGAVILNLPCNLGVGGAVQAGFQYAYAHGYDYAIRIDGDGQHPPSEIPKLVEAMKNDPADLVLGSRFGANNQCISTTWRYVGIKCLALFLSIICRTRVTDPTSGFWMLNRDLLRYFSHSYPVDYPEPEAIALLHRQGYSYCEVPVSFRPRMAGRSSIRAWSTVYYALKVGLALFVDRIRPIDLRFAKQHHQTTR